MLVFNRPTAAVLRWTSDLALVVVVREIIMLPVEETPPAWTDIGMCSGVAELLGLTGLFVRLGQRWMAMESPKA